MGHCKVPFNTPCVVGSEIEYVLQAIQQAHTGGGGPFALRCQTLLESLLGVKKCLLTKSCTDALEMAALLLGVREGDEVIVPAFAFPTTASAFAIRGASPVFADIRTDTLNMDETQLESLITPKTKAIVPVHYAGVGCHMNIILEIAHAHNVPVVEDNAHGLFAKYKKQLLGTFGCLATQSFHETKNFTCGEGGALLINDAALIEQAEIISEKGTDRKRFERGQVDKYTWVELGSSYLPSDMLAAFLYGQLEQRQYVMERRKKIFDSYEALLKPQAAALELQLPTIPSDCEQSHHMYYILLPTEALRDAAIRGMAEQGFISAFHFMPLHLSPAGRRYGGNQACPVTESVSRRLVRLPFHLALSGNDQEAIVDALLRSLRQATSRVGSSH